jgi:hypothetical protein
MEDQQRQENRGQTATGQAMTTGTAAGGIGGMLGAGGPGLVGGMVLGWVIGFLTGVMMGMASGETKGIMKGRNFR